MTQTASVKASAELPTPIRTLYDYGIRYERYADVIAYEPLTLFALEQQHWDTIFSGEKYQPSRLHTLEAESKERFHFFTVRDAANGLVGYLRVKFQVDYKRCSKIMAIEDGWFLLPKARKGRLALALVRTAEEILAAAGIDEILLSHYHDSRVGSLIEHLGYEPTFCVYRKVLEK